MVRVGAPGDMPLCAGAQVPGAGAGMRRRASSGVPVRRVGMWLCQTIEGLGRCSAVCVTARALLAAGVAREMRMGRRQPPPRWLSCPSGPLV